MRNPFFQARVRLTFFYVLNITVLVVLSSIIVYVLFANNILSNQDGEFSSSLIQRLTIDAQIKRLREITLIADLVMLVVSGISGWWLAGRTLRPIQEMVNSQRNFVANASHDLRTPLAILRTNTDLALRKTPAADPMHEFHTINLNAIATLDQLTEELLWQARSESAGYRPVRLTVDIEKLTREIIRQLRPYAASRQIKLQFKGEPAQVLGAEADLKRALSNIIKNAVDYSHQNGRVEISLTHKGKVAQWICRDQGVGISADDLPHIFERNYRGTAKPPQQVTGGNGLGLAIAKTVIGDHGGTIRAESQPGQGTIIIAELPLT